MRWPGDSEKRRFDCRAQTCQLVAVRLDFAVAVWWQAIGRQALGHHLGIDQAADFFGILVGCRFGESCGGVQPRSAVRGAADGAAPFGGRSRCGAQVAAGRDCESAIMVRSRIITFWDGLHPELAVGGRGEGLTELLK